MTVAEMTVVERQARLAEIESAIRECLARTPGGVSLEDLISTVTTELECYEDDVLDALDRVEIRSRFDRNLQSVE